MNRFKTHGAVKDHLQSGHCKSVCTESAEKTVFLTSLSFIGHTVYSVQFESSLDLGWGGVSLSC